MMPAADPGRVRDIGGGVEGVNCDSCRHHIHINSDNSDEGLNRDTEERDQSHIL